NVRNNPADPSTTHLCNPDGGLKITTLPTTTACRTRWNGLCRITINYEANIHPLWGVDRFVDADGDGVHDKDSTGADINHKCTSCHTTANADGTVRVPAGDLDLTDGASDVDPDHFRSYEELLSGDVGQTIDETGALVDECIRFQVDPVTLVQTCVAFRQVAAPMSANGANSSGRFFNTLEGASHKDFMSQGELRLLSEWLDIGAQYYNDPFAAPED
ncbi:MAG TPA: hypothetical protein VKB34_08765, partial [Povalibacter sp.]|nr:hypothetical protein [Povalibacter sp.]